jgi:PPK2 family polyphosphate:nucleotide phosphotransferase
MSITVFDKPGAKVKLSAISEKPPKKLTEEDARKEFEELGQELFELQDLLWGARKHSVLVILQGRDSAGKDGAIKHVVGCLNPRGVHVTSFGVPTPEETEHDFLWRVHRQAPRKGEFAIFNRSHYEDVLVVRVHELVPKSLWKERFDHIRDFEELLAEHGTIVLKFFLHISKGEQKKRLLKREEDPRTAWKLTSGDWEERERWDDYTEAYEEAISRTSTELAPWHIVPADAKWYRNLVVARSIADALRPHRKAWQKQMDEVGVSKKAELEAWRKGKR